MKMGKYVNKEQKKTEQKIQLPGDEFRFFRLAPRDAGRGWSKVNYGEIADRYTLIKFTATSVRGDTDTQSLEYELCNLWKILLRNDQNEKSEEDRRVKKMEKRVADFTLRGHHDSTQLNIYDKIKNYWSHDFNYSLTPDGRKDLKALLRDKNKIYNSLQSHYDTVSLSAKASKKKVILFPMSIFLDRERFSLDGQGLSAYEKLKRQAGLLNKQLPQVIKKLRHRSAYGIFMGYSKLMMLTDEKFEPFIHIIFYLSEDDLSTWYVHDIAKTWRKVSKSSVEIHYYSFTGELPEPPRCEPKVIQVSSKKNNGCFIYYKDVRTPFLSEDVNSKYGVDSILRERLKSLKITESNGSVLSSADLKLLKKESKIVDAIKNTRKYHLNYLSSVAKNYNNIPGLRPITMSEFTYQNQYSNAKYLAKKALNKLNEGLGVIDEDLNFPKNDGVGVIGDLSADLEDNSSDFW